MPVIIDYILKLSICLAIVHLFYQLFLRRLTFYNWNRWYLLGYSALSFVIPLIDIMPELQRKALDRNVFVQMIPAFGFSPAPAGASLLQSLSAWDWIMIAGVAGSLILLVRFFVMFFSFIRIRKRAQLISDARTRIYQLDEDVRPFSFGNAIFINTELHSGEELEEIIRHEFVHVRQKHTIDIIWSELLCILLWFHPFVWLLRKSIKQNLEFLADKQVLQNGMDKKEYQYLLLKVMGNKQFAFANHFNFSSLKNRIAMMNTIKSARIHLTKFLFLLPVVAVLLLAFRKEVIREEKNKAEVNKEQKATDGEDIIQKATRMAEGSPKPVWIVGGIPVAVGNGSWAYFDKQELAGPDDFKVWFDGKIIDMEEANKKVNRFVLKGVGTATKANAYREFGINENLLLLSSTGRFGSGRRPAKDTVPAPRTSKAKIVLSHAGTDPEKRPLIVLDGITQPKGLTLDKVDAHTIESLTVLKDASAESLYGEGGKNGVLIITTKKAATTIRDSSQLQKNIRLQQKNSGGSQQPALPLKGKVTGVHVIDRGIVASGVGDELVYKGYGPIKPGNRSAGTLISGSGKPLEMFKGVYVIDGKVQDGKSLKDLPPDRIESIDVFKGDKALDRGYGEKARNGVIEIKTKKREEHRAASGPAIAPKEVMVIGYGTKIRPARAGTTVVQPAVKTGHQQQQKKGADSPAMRPAKPAPAAITFRTAYSYDLVQTPAPEDKEVVKNGKSPKHYLQLRYVGPVGSDKKAGAALARPGKPVAVKSSSKTIPADTIRIYDKLDTERIFKRVGGMNE
ncbi:M56 family metallopeptidase [Niabella aurantiaca]|uniref:M56 family metallopeptidase n=1 Tax=Niabella aurantiaca TaxID=379900 RepID=UPI00036192E2|nr:M56 family metallopeptidase [Niabella aurantiaca]